MLGIIGKTTAINIRALKETLKNWTPSNKSEAIIAIHELSVLKSAEKLIKTASYDFLDKRCKDCVNHIDDITGLEVIRVDRNKKSYPYSEKVSSLVREIEDAEESLNNLKEQLKQEYETMDYNESLEGFYYKATSKA